MAIYIDSADRYVVEPLLRLGIFRGITTNPTILKKSHLAQDDLRVVYDWATGAGAEQVFMQTRGVDTAEIYDSALKLLDIGNRVVVKIPCVTNGLVAARKLANEGADILLTAVYSPVQALICKELQCWGIAPYVGRIIDNGIDGIRKVSDMVRILNDSTCHVVAASIRSVDILAQLAASGVQDFTVSPDVLAEALDLPESIQALKEFEQSS